MCVRACVYCIKSIKYTSRDNKTNSANLNGTSLWFSLWKSLSTIPIFAWWGFQKSWGPSNYPIRPLIIKALPQLRREQSDKTVLLTWQSFSSFFSFLCSDSGGLLGRYFSLSAGEIEFRCKRKDAVLLWCYSEVRRQYGTITSIDMHKIIFPYFQFKTSIYYKVNNYIPCSPVSM